MLYYAEKMETKVIREVRQFENSHNVRVIFGSMVGSTSRGLNRRGSDYDTRFLFVNLDFPQRIIHPNGTEQGVIYREYYQNEWYEWIPYYEFSSFLGYLIEPCIEKFSYGLYNIIGWTFASRYNWDPYGIKELIWPIIQECFYKDYCIEYHRQQMKLYEMSGKDEVPYVKYLYRLHEALTLDWIFKHNEFAPVDIYTLASINIELIKPLSRIISKAREEADKLPMDCTLQERDNFDLSILVDRDDIIDDYINLMEKEVVNYQVKAMDGTFRNFVNEKIQYMYRLVADTVNNTEFFEPKQGRL